MNKFICSLPFPISCIILSPLPVNPTDKTGDGNPEDQGDNDDCSNNIVLEEFQESLNGEVIEDLPPDVDRVLACLLALSLVTESLEARSSIRKDVHWSHGIAGAVQVPPAASLAGVRPSVAHAGLLALGLAERDTLARPTLALLDAVCPVRHVLRLGTLRTHARALRLLLAGGVVGGPALGLDGHVLAHVAARRVLVAADGVLPQLAVLVTTSISVL